jgi:hypothetical protein
MQNINNSQKYIVFIENKINKDIGFYYWKKYIAAAFWSQISMPINLIITILTAVNTFQATSTDLIPHRIYINISIATLFITVLNTFFRPHEQMTQNNNMVKKWNDIGIEFEELYYNNKTFDKTAINETITNYNNLLVKLNDLKQSEGPDTTNFLTDLIHILVIRFYLKKNQNWLDYANIGDNELGDNELGVNEIGVNELGDNMKILFRNKIRTNVEKSQPSLLRNNILDNDNNILNNNININNSIV